MTPAEREHRLDQEMYFAQQAHAPDAGCREFYGVDDEGHEVHCRRLTGHEGKDTIGHAFGFGPGRVTW